MSRCYEYTALIELRPGATDLGPSPSSGAVAICGHQFTEIYTSPELPAHIPGAKRDHFPGGPKPGTSLSNSLLSPMSDLS